jgi:hypothetical protein
MLIKVWNNREIRWREDGFGCLTDMAKATGKKVGDWLRLKSTNALLEAFSGSAGNPVDTLIDTKGSDVPNKDRGTWADRRICIEFARWCSPQFAVQVIFWADEIMTKGYVDIRNMSPSEIILAQAQRLVDIEKQQQEIELNVNSLQIQQIEAQQKLKSIDEQLSDLIDRNLALESEMERVINPYGSYYTVMGYSNRMGIRNLPLSKASKLGRDATRICDDNNIPIEKVNDPRFGYVGSYPEEVLEEVFNDQD